MEIKEGYMPFMGYQTYYRIVGKTEEGQEPYHPLAWWTRQYPQLFRAIG